MARVTDSSLLDSCSTATVNSISCEILLPIRIKVFVLKLENDNIFGES
jgi:hypothetical protein